MSNKKKIQVYVNPSVYEHLQGLAKEQNQSISGVAELILSESLSLNGLSVQQQLNKILEILTVKSRNESVEVESQNDSVEVESQNVWMLILKDYLISLGMLLVTN